MQSPLLKAPFTNLYSTLSAGVAEISLLNGIQWENAIHRGAMPSSRALWWTLHAEKHPCPVAPRLAPFAIWFLPDLLKESVQIKDMAELGLTDKWIASK